MLSMKTKSWNSFHLWENIVYESGLISYSADSTWMWICHALFWEGFLGCDSTSAISFLRLSKKPQVITEMQKARPNVKCLVPENIKGIWLALCFACCWFIWEGGWGPSNIWVGISVKVIVSAFHTTRQLKWKQNFYPKMEYDKGDLHILKYKWISWFSNQAPYLAAKMFKN